MTLQKIKFRDFSRITYGVHNLKMTASMSEGLTQVTRVRKVWCSNIGPANSSWLQMIRHHFN